MRPSPTPARAPRRPPRPNGRRAPRTGAPARPRRPIATGGSRSDLRRRLGTARPTRPRARRGPAVPAASPARRRRSAGRCRTPDPRPGRRRGRRRGGSGRPRTARPTADRTRSATIVVSPVVASASSSRTVFWSRVSTSSSRGAPSPQWTRARYGNASRSHRTSTRSPLDTSNTPQRHDGVVRARPWVPDRARRRGRVRRVVDVPDLHVALVDVRGREHRAVRRPPVAADRCISSAAMNSARPQEVSGASGEASSRTPPSMSRTHSEPSTTNAMRSPAGSRRGSSTDPGALSSRAPPSTRSARNSRPRP